MATLQQTIERWSQSAGSAQQRYAEGVAGTQVDVVGRAVASQAKLVANFNQSVNSGRWARGLQDVGTAGWKAATQAKAANYSTGIAAGKDNFQKAMATWLPITQSVAAQVQAMPNGGLADSIARMTAYATAMHNAKLQR